MKTTIRHLFLLILCFISFPILAQSYWIYLQGNEFYYGSNTVEPDFDKAFLLYEKAAHMGCPMAEGKLGTCYYLGNGVQQSYRKAFIWTKKAAKHGHPENQYMLGYMYLTGEGCHKNSKRAYKWIYRAADRGNTLAIEYLQQFSLYVRVKYTFDDNPPEKPSQPIP